MKATGICITAALIFIFCFLSVQAGAADDKWVLYHTKPDGTKYYYDSKSISRVYNKIGGKTHAGRYRLLRRYQKAWNIKVREKMVFSSPDSKLKETLALREYDCRAKKIRTLMVTESYRNGSERIEGKISRWNNVDSEPSYEAVYEIVCKP
jgi:hypothetical protein